ILFFSRLFPVFSGSQVGDGRSSGGRPPAFASSACRVVGGGDGAPDPISTPPNGSGWITPDFLLQSEGCVAALAICRRCQGSPP
ncbi:Os06g0346900, partial [Oryza sativa Japonica Group]